MEKLRLPEKNTATSNSIEVILKAVGGFFLGFVVTIAAVPGVQEAALKYFSENGLQLLATFGTSTSVSTGLINFFFDWRKKNMQNY